VFGEHSFTAFETKTSRTARMQFLLKYRATDYIDNIITDKEVIKMKTIIYTCDQYDKL